MLDTLGSRLDAALASQKLTQRAFAARLKSSPTFISNIVNGTKQPGFDYLCKIATELDISLDWLIMGKGTPNNHERQESGDLSIARVSMASRYATLLLIAENGSCEAKMMLDEMLGNYPVPESNEVERLKIIEAIAKGSQNTVYAAELYNHFKPVKDNPKTPNAVLTHALAHYEDLSQDPLNVLMTSFHIARN